MEVGIKTYYFWKPHPYYRKFPRFRCLHIILCSSLVDWHLLIDSFLILFLLIVFHNLLLLQLMLLYLAVSPFHVSSLQLKEDPICRIVAVADMLETCQFQVFWVGNCSVWTVERSFLVLHHQWEPLKSVYWHTIRFGLNFSIAMRV